MRPAPWLTAATLWLLNLAVPPAFAVQEIHPPGAVQERASATVIEIPVNVVGRDGKPVVGLTAEDFELYDNGRKQPISGFEVIDLSRTLSPAAKAQPFEELPPSARRLWLIVFDFSYTSPTGLLRARNGARDFVTRSMGGEDLAAVGTLSVDTGWKLLVNFTRDRLQLAAAIDTLGFPAVAARSTDPLAFAFAPINPSGSPTGGRGPGGSTGDMPGEVKDLQTLQRTASDGLARGRITKLVASLAGIGRVLDSVRGRKHVLLFSEGFETRLLSGNAAGGGRDGSLQQPIGSSLATSSAQDAADATVSGELWKIDSDARFGSSSTRDQLITALSLFNRSDAVLDTIDISGLRAEGDVGAGKPGSGTDALFTMASETNGDFVRNANQLGGELHNVAERTALVYLLVYQPKQLSQPGVFHKLQVKVKASGAKVLARSGYYEPRPYRSLSPLEQLLASGDLITGGEREQGLAAHLLAAPFASPAEVPQVPIVLEIPGSSLLAGDTGEKTGVQIYAYANDASGTLADYIASEMTLDLSKLRASLESGGIKFYGTLYLPAGDYGVRALVRNGTTGRSGVFTAKVRVPKMPGGAPTVLPPFFTEPEGRWVMVRGNPRSDAPARPPDYPFAVAGDSFIPAALPAISNGAETKVAVFTYNLGGGDKPAPLQARLEIVGPDGKARPIDMKITRKSDFERGGGRKLLLSFKPEGLAPGRYALKVAVSDPISKVSSESSSMFEVK